MERKKIEKVYLYLKAAYPVAYKCISGKDFYYRWNKILDHLDEDKVRPVLIAWIKGNKIPPEPFDILKMADIKEYEKAQEWFA